MPLFAQGVVLPCGGTLPGPRGYSGRIAPVSTRSFSVASTRGRREGSNRRQTPQSELRWRGTGISLQGIPAAFRSFSARRAWLTDKNRTTSQEIFSLMG